MKNTTLLAVLSSLGLALGCFQARPFPGEQAEFVIDPVLDFDGEGLNKAIFAPANFDNLSGDLDGDGVDEIFSISTLMVVATDQEPNDFCAQVGNPDFIAVFDEVVTPGTVVGRLDLSPQAQGFEEGEVIEGIGAGAEIAVISFLFARENGDDVAVAVSEGTGTLSLDEFRDDILTATIDDVLAEEAISGDAINSRFEAQVLKATFCPDLAIVIDTIFVGAN